MSNKIFKYTPGPWVCFFKNKYCEWHVSVPISGSTMKRALFEYGAPGSTLEESEGNARLIAAAPDMLNELINFCDYNCTDCSGKTEGCSETCGLKNAKEIIERATGMKMQEVLETARHDAERKAGELANNGI